MFFNDRIVPIAQSGLFYETARDPTLDILDEVVRQELAAGSKGHVSFPPHCPSPSMMIQLPYGLGQLPGETGSYWT